MGGVLPEFRKKGIARKLAEFQESWAVKNGYITILMKTREKYKTMIKFSLNRGFFITDEQPLDNLFETRIFMEKSLI